MESKISKLRMTFTTLGLFIPFLLSSIWVNIFQIISYFSFDLRYRAERWGKRTLSHILLIVLRHKTLILSGDIDKIRGHPLKNNLVISNHQADVDWLILYPSLWYLGLSDGISVVLKAELQTFPFLGTIVSGIRALFLHRDWKKDEESLNKFYRQESVKKYPLSTMFYPEGTTINNHSKKRSLEYAEKVGREKFEHVLLPRSTGFTSLSKGLFDLDQENCVIDCTFAYQSYTGQLTDSYSRPDPYFPTLKSVILGQSSEIHIHMKLYEVKDFYSTTDNDDFVAAQGKLEKWLDERWIEKEQRLEHYKNYQFFAEEKINKEVHYCVNETITISDVMFLVIPTSLIFMMVGLFLANANIYTWTILIALILIYIIYLAIRVANID